MNIKMIEVKFGNCGGSALAHLYGPAQTTMFDRRPYIAVHLSFTLHRHRPDSDSAFAHPNLVILPMEGEMPFLRIEFLLDPPLYADCAFKWPDAKEIGNELTQAIGKIVAVAVQLYGPGYGREVYANSVAL